MDNDRTCVLSRSPFFLKVAEPFCSFLTGLSVRPKPAAGLKPKSTALLAYRLAIRTRLAKLISRTRPRLAAAKSTALAGILARQAQAGKGTLTSRSSKVPCSNKKTARLAAVTPAVAALAGDLLVSTTTFANA